MKRCLTETNRTCNGFAHVIVFFTITNSRKCNLQVYGNFVWEFQVRSYNMIIKIIAGWHQEFEPRHNKTNKMSVRPAKTRIGLGIRPVWSESLLYVQWVAKDPSFLHADSEDSDQTGRMPRLIWVFAGRTLTLLVLSCRGSFSASGQWRFCMRIIMFLHV